MHKFFIIRPIATIMFFAALVLLGLVSFKTLPVSLLPDVDIGEIIVTIESDNLFGKELEQRVTTPLKRKLLHISHLKDIKTITKSQNAHLFLQFEFGTNMKLAFLEANELVDKIMPAFPDGIKRPVITHLKASDIPIIKLIVQQKNNNSSLMELGEYCKNHLRRQLEQLDGIAYVNIAGTTSQHIKVHPNTDQLYRAGLTLNDIINAIKQSHLPDVDLRLKERQYEIDVLLPGIINHLEDLANIQIRTKERLYQLKELSNIRVCEHTNDGYCLYNGQAAVCLSIISQPNTHISTLYEHLNDIISTVSLQNPDLKFIKVQDQTNFLFSSINNLTNSILFSIFLAFIILYLFIKKIKPSLLIGIIIPLSLAISPLFLSLFNISINIISLSGIILAVGMMIDNSIIVVENINQKCQTQSLEKACVEGSLEVAKPILSSILTTCSVFFPLIILSGISGVLFYEQAMTIAIGLFISFFVSLILLPVLYFLFYNKRTIGQSIKKHRHQYIYNTTFWLVFRYNKTIYIALLILIISSVFSFAYLEKRRLPKLESNELLISTEWDQSINSKESQSRMQTLGNQLKPYWQQYKVLNNNSPNEKSITALGKQNSAYFKLKAGQDPEEFKEVFDRIFKGLYPRSSWKEEKSINFLEKLLEDKTSFIQIHLSGISSNEAKNISEQIISLPEIRKAELENRFEKKLIVKPDLKKIHLYKLQYKDVVNQIRSKLGGLYSNTLQQGTASIPIIIQEETTINGLQNLSIKNKSGNSIPLSAIASVSNHYSESSIIGGREGNYFPIQVKEIVGKPNTLITKIRDISKDFKNLNIYFTGSFWEQKQLQKELFFALMLAVVLLYFILAMQFESLLLPLIILIEIPLDLAFVLIMMNIFNVSLNALSMIGMIVMTGIIVNDSILKVSSINTIYREGYSLFYAVHEAGSKRLNAILTTSLTTIIALLPVLIGTGLGNDLQRSLAFSIICGLSIGTIMSIYLTPLLYVAFIKLGSIVSFKFL